MVPVSVYEDMWTRGVVARIVLVLQLVAGVAGARVGRVHVQPILGDAGAAIGLVPREHLAVQERPVSTSNRCRSRLMIDQ